MALDLDLEGWQEERGWTIGAEPAARCWRCRRDARGGGRQAGSVIGGVGKDWGSSAEDREGRKDELGSGQHGWMLWEQECDGVA